jgi:malonate decarboxylase delta subunit
VPGTSALQATQTGPKRWAAATTKRAHVGVVGSGDMEVLLEPNNDEGASVFITTSVDGFGDAWKAVFDRFFSQFDGSVRIYINYAGATPGMLLRLEQAVEVIEQ